MMNQEQIRSDLFDKINRLSISQNEASKRIGVSAATLTNVKKRKWESITHAWKAIETWVYGNRAHGWNVAQTRDMKRIWNICRHAQENGLAKAISFRQGSGKSFSVKHYVDQNQNCFYVEAWGDMSKRDLLMELCRSLGLQESHRASDMLREIIDKLGQLDAPLIVFDEFDELRDGAMRVFKDLYNKARCGFVLVGGLHFEKRIRRGLRLNKQSYNEIYSRIGSEFLELYGADSATVESICAANGLTDQAAINKIIKLSKGDLRSVKNHIEKTLLELA